MVQALQDSLPGRHNVYLDSYQGNQKPNQIGPRKMKEEINPRGKGKKKASGVMWKLQKSSRKISVGSVLKM